MQTPNQTGLGPVEPGPDVYFDADEIDITAVLEEYHRKQMLENLMGPSASLVVHIIVLTLMFIYIVTKPKTVPPTIEVSIVEEEIKEIEPEVLEEIDPETDETVVEPDPTKSEAPSEDIGQDTSPVDVSDDAPQTDDNMDMEDVLDVVATNSPLTLNGLYGGRTNAGRKKAVGKYGGGKGGQRAVDKALKWLASVQQDNGAWGNNSPAHTGMALLVFLAHGETPLSEQYGNTVQMAMKWLATQVNESATGDLGQKSYGHGIATYALCEAYGMTKIPFIRTAMEKALGVIIYGQQDGGGFDYGYKKGGRWDGSVAGWQFQALKAGYVAGATNGGLEDAIRKSIHFLRKVSYKGGKFGYSSPGSGGRGNATSYGVVPLQLLGGGNTAEAKAGVKFIGTSRLELYRTVMNDSKQWDKIASHSMYGWYYDTQAMFNSQNDAAGKARWKQWRPVFEAVLTKHQQPEGYWETQTAKHGQGPNLEGRILTTCWAALQLEVYYRYLPTFDMKKMDRHKVDAGGGDINDAAGGGGGDEMVIEIE